MKRSQNLPIDDVRRVFRVLGHARELRNDIAQQDKVIIDAMTELLGADFGHAMRIVGFRPNTPTKLKHYTPGSFQDPTVMHYISEWGRSSEFDDDPLIRLAWNRPDPVFTLSRSSVMTIDEIRPYRVYEEMVEPSKLNDAIITFFRYPRSNTTRQFVFQRTVSKAEYTPSELQIADLFITELHKLYTDGLLETPNIIDKLPQRLSLMAHQLRTGKSQRQIAIDGNLSYNTVRSYTKELYDTVGVSSREELVAKLFLNTGEN